ncbi:MAG: HD domain-containing protein [Deltaproteobacteria bacterium]|nr:HD domain-containing protein [Deltaproteobacteria bacterium]
MRPSKAEVLALLRQLGTPPPVIGHVIKVEKTARRIAGDISNNGATIDLELVTLGALLHDVGRSQTHGLDHGVIGGRIVRESPVFAELFDEKDREALARICERHIGGGIPARDAAEAGLPERDFLPETLEEKIIAHADNLVWNGVLTVEESRRAFERRFGPDSPVVKRIVKLSEEIQRLAGRGNERDHDT